MTLTVQEAIGSGSGMTNPNQNLSRAENTDDSDIQPLFSALRLHSDNNNNFLHNCTTMNVIYIGKMRVYCTTMPCD